MKFDNRVPQSLIDLVSEIMVDSEGEEKTKREFLSSKGVINPRELSEADRKEFRELDLSKKVSLTEDSDAHEKRFDARTKKIRDSEQMKKPKPVKVEPIDESVTKKHFQQVSDILKEIPDMKKRKELAVHHAGIFKQQNPRFDHSRFYAAAGLQENNSPKKKITEEPESVQELSKKTLQSYITKAISRSPTTHSGPGDEKVDPSRWANGRLESYKDFKRTKKLKEASNETPDIQRLGEEPNEDSDPYPRKGNPGPRRDDKSVSNEEPEIMASRFKKFRRVNKQPNIKVSLNPNKVIQTTVSDIGAGGVSKNTKTLKTRVSDLLRGIKKESSFDIKALNPGKKTLIEKPGRKAKPASESSEIRLAKDPETEAQSGKEEKFSSFYYSRNDPKLKRQQKARIIKLAAKKVVKEDSMASDRPPSDGQTADLNARYGQPQVDPEIAKEVAKQEKEKKALTSDKEKEPAPGKTLTGDVRDQVNLTPSMSLGLGTTGVRSGIT